MTQVVYFAKDTYAKNVEKDLIDRVVQEIYCDGYMDTAIVRKLTMTIPKEDLDSAVDGIFAFVKNVIDAVLCATPTTHAVLVQNSEDFYSAIEAKRKVVQTQLKDVILRSKNSEYKYKVRLQLTKFCHEGLKAELAVVYEPIDADKTVEHGTSGHYLYWHQETLTELLAE